MSIQTASSAIETYVLSTIALVRSLVIKSEISALRVNQRVISAYGTGSVDTSDPRTWKLYMNIAGLYHFSDQPMRVISLDTLQEIDFTKENLSFHVATAEAYRYGTRYYFSLLRKYPLQEQLIQSIVNPVDIELVVKAPDHSILTYYKELVEPQENTLIYDLQRYINNFYQRYTVAGFNNIWKNYPTLNNVCLFSSLVPQTMNLRLLSAKTEKAHSFHITQYLASHGRLDKFIPYMTLKQKIYLYHNIDFIMKHAGHSSTFDELIQWILDDRRIPLASYTVRQLQTNDELLYPELRARRSNLGTLTNSAEAEYLDIGVLYQKEQKTQPGNPEFLEYHEGSINRALATDNTSVIQTKDLESAMVDYTDAVPDPLPEILMRQWAYMSANGLYNVSVNFNHPSTGERYGLLAKDALIYYCYLVMTSMGHRPEFVPEFLNVKYRLHPRPPLELLLRDLVPTKFPDLKLIAQALIASQPLIAQCFSISAFNSLCYKLYDECQIQWFTVSNTHDPMKRAIVAKMISRLYGITSLRLAPDNSNMVQWLSERSLPEFNGTYKEGMDIANVVFQRATGYTVDDTKSLRSIQRAMIEMFSQLSSYSIQIMREINDSAIVPLNSPAVRVGVEGQYASDQQQITAPVRVNSVNQSVADLQYVLDNGDHVDSVFYYPVQTISVNDGLTVSLSDVGENGYITAASVQLPRLSVFDHPQTADDQNKPFHPMQYYDALTQEQIVIIANLPTTRK